MFLLGLVMLGHSVAARFRRPKVNTGSSYAGKKMAVVGATGGLGAAIVRALVREGAAVTVLARDISHMPADLGGDRLKAVTIDLQEPDSILRAASGLTDLDAVIVATGMDVRKAFSQHTFEDVRRQLDINLSGPIWLTHAFLGTLTAGGMIAHLGGFGDGRLALTDVSIFASFAAKEVSTVAAKDALVVRRAPVSWGAEFSGRASRNAGLWVVGAPRWRNPETPGAHHDHNRSPRLEPREEARANGARQIRQGQVRRKVSAGASRKSY